MRMTMEMVMGMVIGIETEMVIEMAMEMISTFALDPFINVLTFQNLRNEIISNAFHLIRFDLTVQ